MKLTVFGAGYVGLAASLSFAEEGHNVLCVENSTAKLSSLLMRKSPVAEPFFQELLEKNLASGHLRFTSDLVEGANWSRCLIIAIGSVEKERGKIAVDPFLSLIEEILKNSRGDIDIILKSTVPVGTCEHIERFMSEKASSRSVKIFFNPEFLRQGSAYRDFSLPQRIVVGFSSGAPKTLFEDLYRSQKQRSVPFLYLRHKEAELAKLAANSFLAVRLSMMNDFALLCDKIKIDVESVKQVIASDHRIGGEFLKAGIGYGGSCLPRDVRNLVGLGQELGVGMSMLQAAEQINSSLPSYFLHKIRSKLEAGSVIAIWGLSFKAGTDDLRDSPAFLTAQALLSEGYKLQIYDPLLSAWNKYPREFLDEGVKFSSSLSESLVKAQALCVLTEDEEFARFTQGEEFALWRGGPVFDGRNILNPSVVQARGLEYTGIGRTF